jgi:hypothetical protein
MYSKKMNQPVDLLKGRWTSFSRRNDETDKFADLDGRSRRGTAEFLEKPLTQEQIAELLQIPPRKKKLR